MGRYPNLGWLMFLILFVTENNENTSFFKISMIYSSEVY